MSLTIMPDTSIHLWKAGEDFEDFFDPAAYLTSYYRDVEKGTFRESEMDNYHHYFTSVSMSGARLLDIGSGPCIHSIISASRVFSNIYLSDYTAWNRQALQDWVDKKPTAHDWKPFMEYVAGLENISAERVDIRVRNSIKGIVCCDVLSPEVVQDMTSFDCITSSACLEGVCQDVASYTKSVKYLYNLLKPGGHIVIFCHLGDEHYDVGDKVFGALSLAEKEVVKAFRDAGFVDINSRARMYGGEEREKYGESDCHTGCMNICARKPTDELI